MIDKDELLNEIYQLKRYKEQPALSIMPEFETVSLGAVINKVKELHFKEEQAGKENISTEEAAGDVKVIFWDGGTIELGNMLDCEIDEDGNDAEIIIRGRGLKRGRQHKPSSNQSLSDVLATYINIYRTVYSTIKELVNNMDDEEIRFISNLIAQKGANSNEN